MEKFKEWQEKALCSDKACEYYFIDEEKECSKPALSAEEYGIEYFNDYVPYYCPECAKEQLDYKVESEIDRFMKITKKVSPKAFINHNNEFIVEIRHNIYFGLKNVHTELDLKCAVIASLSRPSCKGVSNYWQKRMLIIFNEYLGTSFTKEEMSEVYTYLGNDCNRKLSIKFIESGYDLSLLSKGREE
ncbi:hypothetical protein D3C81_1124850 [compost metagenome]